MQGQVTQTIIGGRAFPDQRNLVGVQLNQRKRMLPRFSVVKFQTPEINLLGKNSQTVRTRHQNGVSF